MNCIIVDAMNYKLLKAGPCMTLFRSGAEGLTRHSMDAAQRGCSTAWSRQWVGRTWLSQQWWSPMQMEDTGSWDFQTMKAAMVNIKLLVFLSYRDNHREAYERACWRFF